MTPRKLGAVHDLPAELPEGEHILWQGAPQWWALARSLHIRAVGLYFAALLAWDGFSILAHEGPTRPALLGFLRVSLLSLAAIALFALYAWLVSRTTSYTITNRRVVLHIGVALPVSFNLPLGRIAAAGCKTMPGGAGTIAITLNPGERLGYFVLWPHARPGRMASAEPLFRAIPAVGRVSAILSQALATSLAATSLEATSLGATSLGATSLGAAALEEGDQVHAIGPEPTPDLAPRPETALPAFAHANAA